MRSADGGGDGGGDGGVRCGAGRENRRVTFVTAVREESGRRQLVAHPLRAASREPDEQRTIRGAKY